MNEYYICLRETKEKEKIAIYYDSDIGKVRMYRNNYPKKPYMFEGKDINRTLRLFKYKMIQNAQKICDLANEVFGYIGEEAFKPVRIKESKE